MQRPRIRPPSEYPFPLLGGIDLQTSQLSLRPGALIGGFNYECLTAGGYQRCGGYEPFSGKAKPSDAQYQPLVATTTFDASLVVGDTLTGASTGATGVVCHISADRKLVAVTSTTGVFSKTEIYNRGGSPMATGTSSPFNITRDIDNTLSAAAANIYRAAIAAVPGTGPIRGVTALNDVVYAFRDNVGATACDIYKSTAGGWVQVTIGIKEVKFTAGLPAGISVGDTITGNTSAATGVVTAVKIRSGTFAGSNAAGSLFFASITGTFTSGETLKRGATNVATAGTGTPQSTVSLSPGARFEFVVYNFFGSTATTKIYGVNGVDRAFEFDGTTLYPISTGMTADSPKFITAFKNQIILSFKASIQISGINDPFNWSVITGGATEIAAGDDVTGFIVVPGSTTGGALLILCRNHAYILYGNSSADFKLTPQSDVSGCLPYTAQMIGEPIYLDDIGITAAPATQNFGNFGASTISEAVRPLLQSKVYTAIGSVCVRQKNQYKLFFSDKTGLTVTFGRDANGNIASAGIIPFSYPNLVTCVTNVEIGGVESIFFGSDDGFIYQLNKGRSFNTSTIQAYLRLPYNHCKSPNMRKRFRSIMLEAKSESGATLSITPEFTYASTDLPAAITQSAYVGGSGARWDEMLWDKFFWDETDLTPIRVRIDGIGLNMAMNIFHNSSTELTHTLQSATVTFNSLRQER